MKIKKAFAESYLYLLNVIIYVFVTIVTQSSTKTYLLANAVSYQDIDDFIIFRISGYCISTTLLLMMYQFFSIKMILSLNCIIYILSLITIAVVDDLEIMKYYFLISGSARLSVIISILLLMFSMHRSSIFKQFFLLITAIICGYIVAEIYIYIDIFDIQTKGIKNILLINSMLIFVTLASAGYSSKFDDYSNNKKYSGKNINLVNIIKNIKIEIFSGFMIFYIIVLVINGYMLYPSMETLIKIEETYWKFILIFITLSSYLFTMKFAKRINPHKVILTTSCLLFFLFVSITIWGYYFIISILFWSLILLSFLVIISFSISILVEKFYEKALIMSIICYSCAASFGFYAGYVLMLRLEHSPKEFSFLNSIATILLALILYYMIFFRRNKLHIR